MPSEIIRSLAIPSLAGSVLAMLLIVLRPFTKKIFGYVWHYYIWLAVLVVMLLPVQFHLPQHEERLAVLPIERQEQQTQTEPLPQAQATPPMTADIPTLPNAEPGAAGRFTRLLQNEMSDALGLVWLAGAGGMFLIYLIGYLRLLWKIRKKSVGISCPEIKAYSDKTISVWVCEELASPFMLGLLRPTLILPKKELSAEQLRHILLHEMTHFKRKDILYKWFAILVKCVHWFNPMIYYVIRQINTECEISCDLAVVGRMDEDEQMGYVRTILSLLSGNQTKAIPFTTGMTGNKKILKRRFETMKKKRTTSRWMSALSVMIAAMLLTTTVFASGVFAAIATDNYTIEIFDGSEKIELKNPPFIENNTVYLPLRELLEREGITDIEFHNNGYVEFLIDAVPPVEYRGLEYSFWINRIQIGNPYAYFAGHSNGTTENAELLCAPILKEDTTYVPFDLFDKLKTSGQGVFENMTVTVKNSDHALSGILYQNEDLNFKVALPLGWAGKYGILEEGNSIHFLQTATWDKYGAGTLCSVERVSSETADELLDMLGGSELLYSDENYAYIYEIPTDVQYPVWADRDEEDVAIAAEYQEMFEQTGAIKDSFEIIAHIGTMLPFTDAEVAAARAVVEEYWRAKTEYDREAILKTVTEPNRADNMIYFSEGEKITLNDIRYNPFDSTRTDYIKTGRGSVNGTKYEDVIVFRVDYTVDDKGYSAYNEGPYPDWSMILIRDGKGGEWLIDDQGY